jgi:hypothetical protein
MKLIEARDLKVGDKVYWFDKSNDISTKKLQTVESIKKGITGYLLIQFKNNPMRYNFCILDQLEQSLFD